MAPTTIFNNLNRIPHMWMAEKGHSIDRNLVSKEDVIRAWKRQRYLRNTMKFLIFGINRKITKADISGKFRVMLKDQRNINIFVERVNKIKENPDRFVAETYPDFYEAWRSQSIKLTTYVRYTNILDFL